jgi:hypothetical protein
MALASGRLTSPAFVTDLALIIRGRLMPAARFNPPDLPVRGAPSTVTIGRWQPAEGAFYEGSLKDFAAVNRVY